MAKDEDEGLSAEDIEALKQAGSAAYNAGKGAFNKLKSFISPTKESELAKLQAEVAALEQKKQIEAQIAALKEKKEALMGNDNEEEEEDENVAFADA